MTQQEKMVLNVEEAGKALGIGRGLAYQLVREGKLPALRLGHRLLVPKAALNEMLLKAGGGEDSEK